MRRTRICMIAIFVFAWMITFSNVHFVSAEAKNDGECKMMEKFSYKKEAIRPHFQFYYQLLAEKYAPSFVKVWEDVLKEREAVLKNYKELKKEGKDIEKPYTEEWIKAHGELQNQFLEAVKLRDEKKLKNLVPTVINRQKELNDLWKKAIKDAK